MTKPKKPAPIPAKAVKAAKLAPVTPSRPTKAAPAPPVPQMSDNLPPNPGGKLGLLTALLRQPQGATIVAMCEITGWQKHSVRGALAGTIRKAGFHVTSTKAEGEVRIYRVEAPPKAKKTRKVA